MRNTTKLKHILQIYTVTLDMDADDKIHLSLFHKNKDLNETFIEKSYSGAMSKAFSFMMKNIKADKL